MPHIFSRQLLAEALRKSPDLRSPRGAPAAILDVEVDDGITVKTLATDIRPAYQTATIRFGNLPPQLERLKRGEQLAIEISTHLGNPSTGSKRKRGSVESHTLVIDGHFHGLTVLSSPPCHEHKVDVLAISGLGSHAYGSYVNRQDGHMWLSDSLVEDFPFARVMTYGYDTKLQDSKSFEDLEGLASSFQTALSRLSERSKDTKPLLLIGHSLGGLVIKEAMIRIAESDLESALLDSITGALFFGVPNDGMDIESLIPIVNKQPNRFLLESLDRMNSQVLRVQRRSFFRVLERSDFALFCFYETISSPTAAKV